MTTDTFINLILALYILIGVSIIPIGVALGYKIASDIKERELEPNKKREENVKPAFKRK